MAPRWTRKTQLITERRWTGRCTAGVMGRRRPNSGVTTNRWQCWREPAQTWTSGTGTTAIPTSRPCWIGSAPIRACARRSGVSIGERQVSHTLELLRGGDIGWGQHLNKEDAQHALLGIDPEAGASGSAPIIFALRAYGGGLAGTQIDGKGQAEAVAFRE